MTLFVVVTKLIRIVVVNLMRQSKCKDQGWVAKRANEMVVTDDPQ